MDTLSIEVGIIEIGERHRALSEDAVRCLARSMEEIGLKHPISIRITDGIEVDGNLCDGVPVLVAGAHRLAAAKSLGWDKIDCVEVEDDAIKAEMWEIAENLHRLDLTKEQRDEHIRRYAELLEAQRGQVTQNAAPVLSDGRKSGPQHGKGIPRQIAEETGLSVDTVRRALNPKPRLVDLPEPARDPLEAYYKWVSDMNRLWGRAPQDWRERWLEEIDQPVFDQTRAGAI